MRHSYQSPAVPAFFRSGTQVTPFREPWRRIKVVDVILSRREILLLLVAVPGLAGVPGLSLRGKLVRTPGGKPALQLADGKQVNLEGDGPTTAVLTDQRLLASDFEVLGHYDSPDRFEVDPIHLHAMFVHKDGKRLFISYWCDVCYIRTFAPGTCVCCQKYTDLDLRETLDEQ